MVRQPIIIATTANEAYFHGLCVTVLSAIIATSSGESLRVYVLDTGLSEESRGTLRQLVRSLDADAELVFCRIDGSKFEGFATDYGGGYSAYARLAIGEVVPEERVIYLDADFLVCRDLSELWPRRISPHVMLATPDLEGVEGREKPLSCDCPFLPPEVAAKFTYFNSGCLLVDLDTWRREDIGMEAMRQVVGYEEKLGAWDQTLLNYLLRGRIGRLEPHWSRSCSVDAVIGVANFHFISNRKPWNHKSSMPLYRAWYAFHRIFVQPSRPLGLGLKVSSFGRICYMRDWICTRFQPVACLYIGGLRRRRGARIADAYETHLNRLRRALLDPRWRGAYGLEDLRKRWQERAELAVRGGGMGDGDSRA